MAEGEGGVTALQGGRASRGGEGATAAGADAGSREKRGHTGHPAITVVTALYNCADYIAENVNSLKRQTFGDFEAIIVDDCSTDGSVAAARRAIGDDGRFRVIELSEKRGPASRNVAFDEARGDYLVILDSDDFFVDDALEKLIGRARSQRLDDLYFSARSFYQSEEDFPQLVEDYSNRPSFEGVATGRELYVFFEQRDAFFVQGALRMVSRELVERNHIRMPEGIIHEDILFTFNTLVASKRSSFLNEPIYQRRIRAGSIMNTPRRALANVKGHFFCMCEIKRWLSEHAGELDDDFMEAIGRRLALWGRWSATDWARDVDEPTRAEFISSLSPEMRLAFYEDVLGAGALPDEVADEYERSISYRVGRLVTGVPRVALKAAGTAAHAAAGKVRERAGSWRNEG